MKARLVVIEAYVHTSRLGALQVTCTITGKVTEVAPAYDRTVEYRIGQILTFASKKDAMAFQKRHPGKTEVSE